MIRFYNASFLWLLLIIPILAIIRWTALYSRRKKLRKLGDPALLAGLMPDVSKWRPFVKFWLLQLVLALLILALARPQMGTKITHQKRNGIDAVIALDISNSMLAQDVQPSRLDKSKMMIENMIDHCTDDRVGLVVFAGDAFVQLPITNDFISAKMFLQNVDPSLISEQGTDIGKAIDISMKSFSSQRNSGKAIIIITDGEDHDGDAEAEAKSAHDKGINVFVLGIGSPQGAPIPLGNGNYLKDRSGQTVMTRLNEQMCRQIAQAGSGTYIHVDNTSAAQEQLNNELGKLQKSTTDSVSFSEYNEQFQAFALLALAALIIETLISECKNPKLKNIKFFSRKSLK